MAGANCGADLDSMKTLIKDLFRRHTLNATRSLLRKYVQRVWEPEFKQESSADLAKECLSTSFVGNGGRAMLCYIAYNKYGGYCVPHPSHHRPAAQKILSGDVWEPDTIEFMMKHSSGGDMVHAGAYFGDFIPALSQSCNDDIKLWVFEPNPENYCCALITMAINNLNNIQIKNAGLGAAHGSLSMEISDENGKALGGGSRLLVEEGKNNPEHCIQVDVLKLDDILPPERRVSIIQLDVEGFEQPALAGAMETIRRWKPILILENLPEQDWLNGNILSLGYQITGNLHKNTVLSIS